MELWIRSQKNYEASITPRLIKANDISLDYYGENDSYYILVNNIEFAYYHTEKRALEILDEIQNKIENTIHIPSDINDVSKQVYTPPFMIYEMPEE